MPVARIDIGTTRDTPMAVREKGRERKTAREGRGENRSLYRDDFAGYAPT